MGRSAQHVGVLRALLHLGGGPLYGKTPAQLAYQLIVD